MFGVGRIIVRRLLSRRGRVPSMVDGFTNSRAIVIGINTYSHDIAPLTSAVNDARRLAEILEQDHGYKVQVVLNRQATRAALLDLLMALPVGPDPIGPDDRLLIYFAGHGVALESDDAAGPAGYLVP